MSELCLTSTPKTNSGFLSGFLLFSSLIPSPLLYFSYFVFFSPYLLKLLSPLLITALLLLGLLTVSPVQLSVSQLGFLLSTYNAVAERLRTSLKAGNEDEEFHHFEEELEAYRMVFETSSFLATEEDPDEVSELKEIVFQDLEAPVLKSPVDECSNGSTLESLFADAEEKTVEIVWQEIVTTHPIKEASNRLEEGLLKEFDEFENMRYDDDDEEEKVGLSGIKSDKVEDMSLLGSGSEANGDKIRGGDDGREHNHYCYTPQVAAANPQELGGDVNGSGDSFVGSSNLGSYGSMRRDKEWKRTLACKLFEERHNSADGGEGMDLLWETHDVDSSGNMAKMKSNNVDKKNKNKKEKEKEKSSEYEYHEDEDDEFGDGQLCCLQALKFSAGKVNLGMGRPNLLKISKAIKGIGWFHRATKHGRKGYNNN